MINKKTAVLLLFTVIIIVGIFFLSIKFLFTNNDLNIATITNENNQPIGIKIIQCEWNSFYFIINNNLSPSYSSWKFNWKFGDGYESSQSIAHHEYSHNGHYLVKLIITGGDGGTYTAEKTILVDLIKFYHQKIQASAIAIIFLAIIGLIFLWERQETKFYLSSNYLKNNKSQSGPKKNQRKASSRLSSLNKKNSRRKNIIRTYKK